MVIAQPARVFLRGLPPSRPLALDAAFFAKLLDFPPAWPSLDAIHLFDPKNPSKMAGR